jgi:hypothetical protein
MMRRVTARDTKRTRWSTFAGWHRDADFWQGVWANALSGLIVALAIYVVAALTGVVTRKPLAFICLACGAFAGYMSVDQWRGSRRGDEYTNMATAVWFGGATLVFAALAVTGWVKYGYRPLTAEVTNRRWQGTMRHAVARGVTLRQHQLDFGSIL